MKKFGFIALAALMSAAACSKGYDDSDLQNRLDKIEGDISNVEKAIEGYKAQVKTYQAFIDAFQTGSYVTSFEEIMDGDKVLGYRIAFGDGIAPIEIMNGRDGLPGQDGEAGYSPVLGVSLVDGRYFWTVDGTVREDMPASPDAGSLDIKNGETPEISVRDGKWVIRTGGVETELGPVSESDARVSDDVFGNVEKTDYMLKVTLANGTVMEFPLLTEYSVVLSDTQDPLVKDYRISGKFTSPTLNVFCPGGWKAVVEAADGLTGKVTLVPDASVTPGQYSFNVLVTDGMHSTSTVFAVTVSDNQ